ncbi:hypothetical protein MHBO_003706, partial [Bonamia ostreae]
IERYSNLISDYQKEYENIKNKILDEKTSNQNLAFPTVLFIEKDKNEHSNPIEENLDSKTSLKNKTSRKNDESDNKNLLSETEQLLAKNEKNEKSQKKTISDKPILKRMKRKIFFLIILILLIGLTFIKLH